MSDSSKPMEDAMRAKLTQELQPTTLIINNDSHKHAHHAAMKSMGDNRSSETHFRVVVASSAFAGKMQPARHRMVYTLLKDEMAAVGGIHALQLQTRTPEEQERAEAKEKA